MLFRDDADNEYQPFLRLSSDEEIKDELKIMQGVSTDNRITRVGGITVVEYVQQAAAHYNNV